MSIQGAEFAHQSQIVERLKAMGLTTQINVPLRKAGVVADVLVTTDKGRIVIEAAAIDVAPNTEVALKTAIRKAQHVQRATGARHMLVVVPEVPAGEQPEFVVALADLKTAVEKIQAQPAFRSNENLGEDEGAPVVFASMPPTEEMLDTFFDGVITAAMDASAVVDRVENTTAAERVAAGMQAAVAVIADVTGGNVLVMNQLHSAQKTQKPVITICESGKANLPENMTENETIFYERGALAQLRQTLAERLRTVVT